MKFIWCIICSCRVLFLGKKIFNHNAILEVWILNLKFISKLYFYMISMLRLRKLDSKSRNGKTYNRFQLHVYRRILKISWTQKVSNVRVLDRIQKQPDVLYAIKERKVKYLGHIMRGGKI